MLQCKEYDLAGLSLKSLCQVCGKKRNFSRWVCHIEVPVFTTDFTVLPESVKLILRCAPLELVHM